ncbi:hypothetical protein Sj15T_27890 [Sphingobium sp. TA15]|nr:hypothetical protein Sj15T_27890 [Sphingobium sp. TA15]
MRGGLPLALLYALAGCGSDETPAANIAQPHASTPIAMPAPTLRQGTENRAKTVPRETGERSPVGAPPVKHYADDDYRAIGTEPFWAVTVNGSTAVLERPDKAPVRYAITRNDDKRALRFLGEGFSMTVTEGPCSDGMSDALWSDRVAVAFGEGTLNGCGGLRDDLDEP